jgi:hypothetical protein
MIPTTANLGDSEASSAAFDRRGVMRASMSLKENTPATRGPGSRSAQGDDIEDTVHVLVTVDAARSEDAVASNCGNGIFESENVEILAYE